MLILFSGFCFVAAVWRQFGEVAPPHPDMRRLPRALVTAVSGFLLLVALAALIGLWLGAGARGP
jgi:putative membrane protein